MGVVVLLERRNCWAFSTLPWGIKPGSPAAEGAPSPELIVGELRSEKAGILASQRLLKFKLVVAPGLLEGLEPLFHMGQRFGQDKASTDLQS